mmetsp:Transcript_49391/g.99425  ORF Transcript_49391/g.99425 Transcript_49391/m.99425 type:complete len:339 (-) Transcript_49391:182-1198(-)
MALAASYYRMTRPFVSKEAKECTSLPTSKPTLLVSKPALPPSSKPAAPPVVCKPPSRGQATEKLYLKNTWLFEFVGASLVSSSEDEEGEMVLVLDKTIFHPQGGGQPTDMGTISAANAEFSVSMVKEDRSTGLVLHTGRFTRGSVTAFQQTQEAQSPSSSSGGQGQGLSLAVDQGRRRECARLHSAGHALDVAMAKIGHAELKATKGYHFSDGPYVEYEGKLSPEAKEALPGLLTAAIRDLVAGAPAALATEVRMVQKAEAKELLCGGGGDCDLSHLPDKGPDGKPALVRLVSVAGGWCPCGGTHVENAREIGEVTVTKIKCKKNTVKVSYVIAQEST